MKGTSIRHYLSADHILEVIVKSIARLILLYLIDIIVVAEDFDKYMSWLGDVFQGLRKTELKLKLFKC